MPITKGFRALVDEAMAQVATYSVDEVRARLHDPKVQIVDIRDVRELEREGTVPGALLAPRGMLEFWVDPESPYFKPVFADEGKEFILFCGAGWRSALATKTLKDMGMTNVAHIDGGFAAWKKADAPMVTLEQHKAESASRKGSCPAQHHGASTPLRAKDMAMSDIRPQGRPPANQQRPDGRVQNDRTPLFMWPQRCQRPSVASVSVLRALAWR